MSVRAKREIQLHGLPLLWNAQAPSFDLHAGSLLGREEEASRSSAISMESETRATIFRLASVHKAEVEVRVQRELALVESSKRCEIWHAQKGERGRIARRYARFKRAFGLESQLGDEEAKCVSPYATVMVQPHCPPTASTERAPRPSLSRHASTVYSIVDLRPLEREEAAARRALEGLECQRRSETVTCEASEKIEAREVGTRRRQEERLEYWRAQRKARHEFVVSTASNFVDGVFTSVLEAQARPAIVELERAARAQLHELCCHNFNLIQQSLLATFESETRQAVEIQLLIDESWAHALRDTEELCRAAVAAAEADEVPQMAAARKVVLEETDRWRFYSRHAATIQRKWRLILNGLLGWRCTHRRLRQEIWILRTRKKHLELHAYRQSLMKTLAELEVG